MKWEYHHVTAWALNVGELRALLDQPGVTDESLVQVRVPQQVPGAAGPLTTDDFVVMGATTEPVPAVEGFDGAALVITADWPSGTYHHRDKEDR